MSDNDLEWPRELARAENSDIHTWSHRGSNICLDFHGDVTQSKLVVFSDGNHHMALHESIQNFVIQYPKVVDVFYATTPPSVLLDFMSCKKLLLGNLVLSVAPNIFISPSNIINKLAQQSATIKNQRFMASRGNVLLVRKGNPKNILQSKDLFRDDVGLFISNPETEKPSFEIYRQTLMNAVISDTTLQNKTDTLLSASSNRVFFGRGIHHRELPQALVNNDADVAIVYYHLALRYTRIFPELFEIVEFLALNSTNNPVTEYNISLLNNHGEFGELFYDYMLGATVQQIYHSHGLSAV